MRDTFGFHHGDGVRDRHTGTEGLVRLWDADPREPDGSIGEVTWYATGSTDELSDARHRLDLVTRNGWPARGLTVIDGRVADAADQADPVDARPMTTATMTVLIGNVLGGRYPVDGQWASDVQHIDLAPDEICALEIRTEAGQVFRVEVTETAKSLPVGERVSLRRDGR